MMHIVEERRLCSEVRYVHALSAVSTQELGSLDNDGINKDVGKR